MKKDIAKIIEALEIGIVMAEKYSESSSPMTETYNQDILKMIQAKVILSKFGTPKDNAVKLDEDKLREIIPINGMAFELRGREKIIKQLMRLL